MQSAILISLWQTSELCCYVVSTLASISKSKTMPSVTYSCSCIDFLFLYVCISVCLSDCLSFSLPFYCSWTEIISYWIYFTRKFALARSDLIGNIVYLVVLSPTISLCSRCCCNVLILYVATSEILISVECSLMIFKVITINNLNIPDIM